MFSGVTEDPQGGILLVRGEPMTTPRDKLNVVKAMAVMAWSDGNMDEREAKNIRAFAERMGLDARGRSAVEGYLRSRPSISGLNFEDLEQKERDAIMLAAVHFAYLDGAVTPGERDVLVRFADSLGIDAENLVKMEEQTRQRLWK